MSSQMASSAAGGLFGGPAGAFTGANGFSPGSLSTNLGGLMSGITGQSQVANTTGQIANAQLGQQQADRNTLMGLLAPSTQDIQQLQQAVATNAQSIQQSQTLLNAADPALVQAAQNAQQLLQGGSSPLLAPIQNQRAQGRAQLQQQLQQQLGPGYATSSAGIQALNNYDQATTNAMTQAQQSTLGQLMGSTQYGAQLGAGQQQQGISNSTGLARGNSILNGAQANAILGSPVNPGLAYTGQLANNQINSQNLQSLFGFAGQQMGNPLSNGSLQGFGNSLGPQMPAGAGAAQSIGASNAGESMFGGAAMMG